MTLIAFRSADRSLQLPGKTAIKDFIGLLFRKEKKRLASITYVFCSDQFLLQMNRDFLDHDYYTDIITFGLSDKGHPIEAEVYISLDRVKDNARIHGATYREETLRVILHGALHLCGYGDKKKREITIMREKEDYYLRLFEKTHKNG
ncbi:MAG: ybeY [Sediminibacterium sp.]|nr:ybeY [Sediminibacterium sp.]